MNRGGRVDADADAPAGESGRAAGAAAFGAGSRLLVIAPHPDDETIAAAGLMQAAHAAGAEVAVWLLTDGDNNPWPQRWIERRWRIDAAARQRWGMRRRAEAVAALCQLGLDPEAGLCCFGWPDGGLTERLVADPAGCTTFLASALRRFAPTHLVMPAAADRHPDHGAAALLLTLALGEAGLAVRILAYCVHGDRRDGAGVHELTQGEWLCKQRAVAEYRTQAVLTGPRLRRLAGRHEAFRADAFDLRGMDPGRRLEVSRHGEGLVCNLRRPHPTLSGQRLLVVTVEEGVPAVRIVAGAALTALAQRSGAATCLIVPAADRGACEIFVKLEPLRRGSWIFDRYPWTRLSAHLQILPANPPISPQSPAA